MQQCVGVQVPMPAPASAQSPLNFVSGNSQRLLPKTAFAPLRLLPNPKQFGFGFVFYYLADFVSLATAFFRSEQTPSRTHSAAPPFQIEPAALGFNLGFYFCAQSVRLRFRQQPEAIAENCAHFLAPPSKSEALGFGFVFSFASYVSLATAFFRSEQTPSRTHSAAPPFQIEPAALGFNLGFLFLGQRIVRDGIEHVGTIGTNKPATAPQMRCRCRFCPRLKNSYTRVLYGLSRASR